jgi:hypothetical protein
MRRETDFGGELAIVLDGKNQGLKSMTHGGPTRNPRFSERE